MATLEVNAPVTLTPSGAHAVVVDTPDTVAAERGLRGHYRVRLDNGTTRLVAGDRLRAVEEAPLPFHIDIGANFIDIHFDKQLSRLTAAEAEALVVALQHALTELAIAEPPR